MASLRYVELGFGLHLETQLRYNSKEKVGF